jgi:hypothetical protein
MIRHPDADPEHHPRKRRKSVTAAEITEFLEYLAPPSLGSASAGYGLQVGAPTQEVRSIVLAPTASYTALTTAAARKDTLLLTAAPLIRKPLHQIRRDDPIGAKLAYLLEHKVMLYALSNSFASANGGFDDALAEALGLAATSLLVPTAAEAQYKIAVYTPNEAVERVFKAASEAGAGRTGNYSHCSFQTAGKGTFLPNEGASPAIGKVGTLETVAETKIEMIVSERELQGVLAAILNAHPYEEVAYDVLMLKNPGTVVGRGRMGELPLNVSLDTVLAQVQDTLDAHSVRLSHRHDLPISSVAVVCESVEGVFKQAHRNGAGALITGGADIEDMMLAEGSSTVLIDIGFACAAAPGLQRLCRQLTDTFASDGIEILYAG